MICANSGPGRDSMEAHGPHEYQNWSGQTAQCDGIPHTPTSEPVEGKVRVVDVTIEAFVTDAFEGFDNTNLWSVHAVFDVPLEHNTSHGIVVRGTKMAERLKAAMLAQVCFTDFRACTNIYGQPYLGSRCLVGGKWLNADLKRMGF